MTTDWFKNRGHFSIAGTTPRTIRRWIKAGKVPWKAERRKGASPAKGIPPSSLGMLEKAPGKDPLRYRVQRQLIASGYDPSTTLAYLVAACEGGADIDLAATGLRFCITANENFLRALLRKEPSQLIPTLCANKILEAGLESGLLFPILLDLPFSLLWDWLLNALNNCPVSVIPYLFINTKAPNHSKSVRVLLFLPQWIHDAGPLKFDIPSQPSNRFLKGFFLHSVWFPYPVENTERKNMAAIGFATQLHDRAPGGINEALSAFASRKKGAQVYASDWECSNLSGLKEIPCYATQSPKRYDVQSGKQEISDATIARILGVSRAAVCKSKTKP